MRILVCGSRGWANHATTYARIREALLGKLPPSVFEQHVIIHGNAPCVDQLAGAVARGLGYLVEVYPADWNKFGRGAGFKRNQQMLTEGKPNLVLAFWDGQSRGTKHMIDLALKAGIPVEVIQL